MIRSVRKSSRLHLIVGGGIRSPSQARSLADAGAQLIVTGTVSEQASVEKVRKYYLCVTLASLRGRLVVSLAREKSKRNDPVLQPDSPSGISIS